MKITDVRVEHYRWPKAKPIANGKHTYTHNDLNLLVIDTDEGITGYGCSWAIEFAETMGKAMGILIDQDRLIFPEIAPVRLLSGGIIADNRACELLRKGLKEYNSGYEVIRLDEETMYSPLLKSMKPEERNFNVAIGSAYIGNRFLIQ